jgi:hypothetical protein
MCWGPSGDSGGGSVVVVHRGWQNSVHRFSGGKEDDIQINTSDVCHGRPCQFPKPFALNIIPRYGSVEQ